MYTPDEDERWLEVQHLSRAIAEESIFPINKVESALCYVVVRARELERRLREAEQRTKRAEAEAKVLREALNDQIQWVAAFAMGCGQHDVVMDSDRMKRARAALAAKEPARD